MVVMYECEVESLVEGWGGLAFEIPGLIMIDVFDEIPHSCLEYGKRVIGWSENWLVQSMFGWNVEVAALVGFYIH